MNLLYYDIIQQLKGCTFLPGSWPKRFVRDLSYLKPDDELSDKQKAWLLQLWKSYRRQTPTGKEK